MSSAKLIVDQTTDIDDINLSKVQDLSSIAKQELNHFDTTYENNIAENYEKMKSEMLAEPEIISSSISKVDNEFFPTIKLKGEEETPEKVVSINLRGKLIIGVFASIVLLLSILLIYNAVLINRYRASIGDNSQIVINLENENSALQGELDSLLNGISPDSVGMQEGVYEEIDLIPRSLVKEIPAESNWFDSICNFFSSLFGG